MCSLVGGGGVPRNNRAMNRSSVTQRRFLAGNRILLRQQRRQTRGTQDLRRRLNFPIQRQRRPLLQQAQPRIGRRSINFRAQYRKPIRNSDQRLVTNTVSRGSWRNVSALKRKQSASRFAVDPLMKFVYNVLCMFRSHPAQKRCTQ